MITTDTHLVHVATLTDEQIEYAESLVESFSRRGAPIWIQVQGNEASVTLEHRVTKDDDD